ncbi:IPT/TIG domain-containing protein [Candidatus Margulisiibacteriota bacterium]
MIRKMFKKAFAFGLIAASVLAIGSMVHAGGSQVLIGYVKGNVTANYKVYVTAAPTKNEIGSLTYDSGSDLSYYAVDVYNFYPDWKDKQIAVGIVEKGIDGSTAQYGVAALTLDEAAGLQDFAQISALAAIPKPTATVDTTNGEVDLTWTAAKSASTNPTGIAGYNVYRSTNGTTYTKINSAVVTTASYSDKAGTTGTKYTYAIKIVFAGTVESLRSAASAQVTFPPKPTTASISKVTPNTGEQGKSYTVTIDGTGTKFTANSNVTFSGTKITVSNFKFVSATRVTVTAAIASDATVGKRDVSVDAVKGTGMFTVTAPGVVTSVPIDKFEGDAVDPATGYYKFSSVSPATTEDPTILRQSTTVHNDNYAMSVTYPASTGWGRGFGGKLKSNIDISSMTNISLYVLTTKDFTLKFQVKDADGDNHGTGAYTVKASGQPFGLATWQEVTIPISALAAIDNAGALDLTKIAEYQVVFADSAASTDTIYIDDITAKKVTGPYITKLNNSKLPVDGELIITGTGFGNTKGKIEFKDTKDLSVVTLSDSSTLVTSWKEQEIILKVPKTSGTKKLTIVTAANEDSNEVDFEVSAQSTGVSYNYPNPFNPSAPETTKIVFSPGSNTEATIYVFDITARIVEKLEWTGGTAEVTWNGKNAQGEILGDGVYLYRVVAGGKLIGKGKILIINQ